MLSIESESRLAECFLRAAEGERHVEFRRAVLAGMQFASLRALFEHVDRCNNGFVSCADVQDQVCLAGGFCSDAEALLVVRQYDGDTDGRLSYAEFSSLILPATNPSLREEFIAKDYPHLSPECESAFCELILAELECQRDLESARTAFAHRYDFNLLDAFRTVDTADSACIATGNLISFMQRRDIAMTKEMADAVIRRVDMDGDMRISYVEFVDFLLPMKRNHLSGKVNGSRVATPSHMSLKKTRPPTLLRSSSPLNGSEGRQLRFSTPLKSPSRAPQHLSYTPDRGLDFSLSGEEIAACVKSDVELYRDLQWAKSTLVQAMDFSPIAAFRLFDRWGRNEISPSEFSSVLYSLGVAPLDEDVKALFFSYGSGRRLSYLDFVDLISPEGSRVTERMGPQVGLSHDTMKKLARVCEKALAVARVSDEARRSFSAVEHPERLLEEASDRLRVRLTGTERLWLLSRYNATGPPGLSASQLQ